ncbi:MAG: NAD(P)/FAD-dependent oxidoreductase [Bacilli bacterium]|jgi:alkyl hydroperoxide reductase subunit F
MFNLQLSSNKSTVNYDELYDFIALGLGPAGLNAGLYAERKGLKTLVVGQSLGGQLGNTSEVENYLGFPHINAQKLIAEFKNHIDELGVTLLTDVIITRIEKNDSTFIISLNNGKKLRAKTVLYALGGNPRKLGVPGEDRLAGKGVSYCVTCDGPFYKGKDVVVAGGGNSAIDAARNLARIANSVTVIQRSVLRADKKSVDKLLNQPNVKVLLQTQITEILGEERVTGVRIFDKTATVERVFKTDGLFIEIGNIPSTSLLENLVDLNVSGEVIVNDKQQTSLSGLFAAGDITANSNRQIIIAAAEGAKAALEAANYINN